MINKTLFCFLFMLAGSFSPTAHSFNLLIKNVKVISKDGEISKPIQVWIKNGIIIEITASTAIKSSKKYKVVNGKNHYLIPGLIDSHVHLSGVPGESERMPAKVRQAALRQIPRSYLYFGFTTLLDLFSSDEQINEWNQQPIAPTAYHCTGVPIPGGYPLALQLSEGQLSHPAATFYLFDPRQALLMKQTPDSQSHKTQPLVADIARTNAICIKAFYDKGFGPFKNLPVPSVPMMRELVTEAHNKNLPVYIHGTSVESHEFALQTGADLLVHGIWRTGHSDNPAQAVHQIAKKTANAGLGIHPTLQVLFGELEILNSAFFDNPLLKKAMPPSLIKWYQSTEGQWFAEKLAKNLGEIPKPERYQAGKKSYNTALQTVQTHLRALHKAKADLYFGSDTPSGPLYTQFPGFNGQEEISRWAEQDIPLLTLFQSLTIKNAKLLKLSHKIGSIEVGKTADLLILSENPLESASAYGSIEWVILGGKAIKREDLAAD